MGLGVREGEGVESGEVEVRDLVRDLVRRPGPSEGTPGGLWQNQRV